MSFITEEALETVGCEQDGSVAIITLNRPEAMNSISEQLSAELHIALDRAEKDDSVRVIVLTGAGDRAFCAGYDLTEPPESPSTSESLRYWWDVDRPTPDRLWHIMRLEKPVIAAVNGWCLAGGFWYALSADITIASDRAVFGQPEIRELQGSTVLFSFLVGWKHAHRYALTGDHFDAREAERIGVVNEVVPHEELMDHALALAQRVAMVPAESLRLNKRITVLAMETMGLRTALESAVFLETIVHATATDSKEIEDLRTVRREQGIAASLKLRDDKFRPEPGGPRSKSR
jgi:enoyl-CoA hydratase/carnithine racemase